MQICAEIGGRELTFEMSMHGTHWAMNALGFWGASQRLVCLSKTPPRPWQPAQRQKAAAGDIMAVTMAATSP